MARLCASVQWVFCAGVLISIFALALWPDARPLRGHHRLLGESQPRAARQEGCSCGAQPALPSLVDRGRSPQVPTRGSRPPQRSKLFARACAKCGSLHVTMEWQTVDRKTKLLALVLRCRNCGYALDLTTQRPVTKDRPGLKMLEGRKNCPNCGSSDLAKKRQVLGRPVVPGQQQPGRVALVATVVTCRQCGERWADKIRRQPMSYLRAGGSSD